MERIKSYSSSADILVPASKMKLNTPFNNVLFVFVNEQDTIEEN
ncbi:hypothetical protein [endosymbiont GvMRE of Glomus versiforme]|nr:hypothetical protein [endosymbiont GvMRE of Glomus versiforme]